MENVHNIEKKSEKRRLFKAFLFFLLFSPCMCVFTIASFWPRATQRLVPVPLHSILDADYTGELIDQTIPQIRIRAIEDAIRDELPRSANVEDRIQDLLNILEEPIPYVERESTLVKIVQSPSETATYTATHTATVTASPTPTITAILSETPTLILSPTVIVSTTLTSTPTFTISPTSASPIPPINPTITFTTAAISPGDTTSTFTPIPTLQVSTNTPVSSKTPISLTATNTIVAPNSPPIADADSDITNEDMAMDIAVASNDSDSDGTIDVTTVTITSGASNGTTTVNPTTGIVNYIPNVNFYGSDSFIYTVKDDSGSTSNTATVTITVNAVNDPPVANDDSANTNEDMAVDINVALNDTDVDDALDLTTVTIVSGTSNGGTSVNPTTGMVTYTPNVNFNGSDSFTYTIDDASGDTSNVATVTITVNAVNDSPIANEDTANTNEDMAVNIIVTSNDTDVDDGLDLTTVSIISGTSNGGTSVNPTTGVVTYTPNVNFNGSDSFTYTIDDLAGDTSNVATVTITVNAVNDLPVANNDSTNTNEDIAVNITVTSNDTDIDDALDLTTVTIISGTSNGGTSINPTTGVVTYNPNLNFNGSDSFTYTVKDATGDTSNTATVTITVNAVNDPPVANDDSATTNEDMAVNITVTSNNTDIDDGLDLTTVSIISGTSNGGTSVNPTTGVVTYTPNVNFNGSDSFTYTIDDASGSTSNVAAVTITVNAVNDPPVANDDSATTNEDMAVDINVALNDADVDDGLDLTTVTVVSGTSNGSTSINPTTGVVTYTPNLNFNGLDSFTYTIDDLADDTSNIVTVTITVNAVNDPPVANDDNANTDEDSAVNITVTSNDTDIDDGLDLTMVTIVSGTSNGGTSINPTTGVVTYTPNLNFNGSDSFTYTIDDVSGSTSNVATVTITVNAVNDPPVANDDTANTNEDIVVNITVTSNDTDVDDGLDLTTVTVVSGTSNGGTSVNPTTGMVTYTPNLNFNGADRFTYSIEDTTGDTSNVATVTITVNAVNDPPVANDDNANTDEDSAVNITVTSNDTDIDDGLDLTTVSIISGTSNGGTSVNPTTGVVTYTPNVNFNGSDSFTYTIDDASGSTSNVATVTIIVNAVNDPPIANDDTANTNEDIVVNITVTSNDTDVDDGLDLTTVSIISGTSNGSTSINPTTGVVTYTPNLNFNGLDSFTYTIDDLADDTSNVVTVTITVNAVNDSPIANDDSANTNEDMAVDINVALNDTDVDDGLDLTTVTIISGTSNGGTSINPTTGVVTYTPNLNFNGADSFTYTIDDVSGSTSNVATVTIIVNAVNDLPVANDDSANTDEDIAVNITVTSNDTDVDNGLDLTTVTIISGTSNGSTSVNPTTGVVTYDPNLDFNGSDTFTYTVDDASGSTSNVATVTITVNAVNDPPVANDDSANTNEDTAVNITMTSNDTDVDDGHDLTTVTIVSGTSNGGTSVNPTTGVVTYTPNVNFNGSDSFTYTIDDVSGSTSNVATVTITVNAVNDPPVTNDDSATTNEDIVVNITVTSNDTDIDDGLDLTTVTIVSGTSNGGTSINPTTGVVTYTPNLNFNGSDSFTYTIDDVSGSTSNVATVTITVNAVNDPPVTNDDSATTNEDIVVNITMTSNDTDVDDGLDLTTVSIISGTSNGSTSINPTTGVVTYTPNLNFNGLDSFTYTIDDTSGDTSNVATAMITVYALNDPPVANDDSANTNEDTAVNITMTSNDTDVDDGLDLTTVTIISGTSNGSTSINPTTGVVTYTPNLNFNALDSFTYTIDDTSGDTSNVATATITVYALNDPPVAVDDNANTNEDIAVNITVTSNDTDVDDGLDLTTVSIISGTSNGGTSVNPTTGVVTYTANLNFNGTDSFAYSIKDATGDTSNTATVTITVNAVNDPPVANDDNPTMTEDGTIDIFVFSNDTDVDNGLDLTTVTIISGTSNGSTSVNPTTGVVTYDPNLDFNGSDTFTYTVDDASGSTSNVATVTITVNAVNDPPVANDDSANTNEDTAVNITMTSNDTDVDDGHDLTTVTIVSGTSNGGTSVNPTTGVVTYTPNVNFNGSDSFTYTIDDASGSTSNIATVTITVNAVNDPPVTNDDFASTYQNRSVDIFVSSNDTDIDDTLDTTTVVVISSPSNGGTSVNPTTGVVTYTPNASYIGDDSFTYTIKDSAGDTSNIATVTLAIVDDTGCSLPLAVDGTLPDGFVQSVTPADESTGIILSTNTITISFNQPMLHGGGGGRVDNEGNYELYQTADTGNKIDILSVDYDLDTYVVTLTIDTSDEDWISGTSYELKIKNNVENRCGDEQSADVLTQFTTQSGPGCSLPLAVDGILPDGFVQSVVPADDATSILLSTNTITISFNQPMWHGGGGGRVDDTGNYELYQTSDTGNKIDILTADYDLDTYVITLTIDTNDEDWISGTEFELKIKDSIENECGDAQGADVLTQFTTQAGPGCSLPVAVDGILPDGFVDSVVPADEATSILLSTNTITISFNQPMWHGGGGGRVDDNGNYDLYQTADTGNKIDILSADYDLDSYVVTLTIDSGDEDWISGTEYELSIKDKIENECGDDQVADVFTQFTTQVGPGCSLPLAVDGTLPDGFVDSVVPADETTNILLSANTITISFNQPMWHGGGGGRVDDNGNYDLYQTADTGNKIDILSADYDLDSYVVTLTIDSSDEDWISGTEYELSIKDNIENECGDDQAADVFTQFTTATGPGCSLPLAVDGTLPDGFVQSVMPADGAIGVLLSTNTITVSFNQPMWHGGGGGRVDDEENYELYHLNATGNKIDILSADYDLDNYEVTLTFDTSDEDWMSGTEYELSIKDKIENECEDDQAADVFTQFATNYLPIANSDTGTTIENVFTIINVLANDTDVDGTIDPTTVIVVAQPTNGMTSVNPTTGAITYTPDLGFKGVDTFYYVVSDNAGATSNMATVTITVTGILPSVPLYLHNNPSPPIGNTTSQSLLPLDVVVPLGLTLFNYDLNRDSDPGLMIQKGGSGMGESDLTKVQRWKTAPFLTETVIPLSNIKLKLWSSMKDFEDEDRGYVVAYFAVRNAVSTDWFIVGSLNDPTWNDGIENWRLKDIDLGFGGGTIPAGYWIEVTVVVNSASDDDMWFAYDTLAYPSRIVFE